MAVAALIIACPCAGGLATPVSIMVGVGRGAQLGGLDQERRGAGLSKKVDTLVDKTGILTEVEPSLTPIVPANGFESEELLRLAAGVERASEHPLSQAVVAGAELKGVVIPSGARSADEAATLVEEVRRGGHSAALRSLVNEDARLAATDGDG